MSFYTYLILFFATASLFDLVCLIIRLLLEMQINSMKALNKEKYLTLLGRYYR